MQYDNMSRADMIALIESLQAENHELSYDVSFGIMKKERGLRDYSNIANGTDVIFIDLANVHAANHLYTMDGYDHFIQNVMENIKHADTVIRWGGDEIVIIPRNGTHIDQYIDRLCKLLFDNNIYAVIASTKSTNGLKDTIKILDKIVSDEKLRLETCGLKPSRDEKYRVMESIFIAV